MFISTCVTTSIDVYCTASYVRFICSSFLSLYVFVLKFCSHFLPFLCTHRRLRLCDLITPTIFRVHVSYKGLETSNCFTLFIQSFITKRTVRVTPTKAVFSNLIKYNAIGYIERHCALIVTNFIAVCSKHILVSAP